MEQLRYFDIHTHLQDKSILPNINNVLLSATDNNIEYINIASTNEDDIETIQDIKHNKVNLCYSFGIHPWYVERVSDQWDKKLLNILSQNTNYSVGEIGLDFYDNMPDKDLQIDIFKKQLYIAKELNRPVIIHSRKAAEVTYNIIKKVSLRQGFVIHSYSYSAEMAKKLEQLNGFFSFSTSICNEKNKRVKKVLPIIPISRIMAETDSPYMIPYTLKKKAHYNEPSNIKMVLSTISRLLDRDLYKLSNIIFNNSYNYFFGGN